MFSGNHAVSIDEKGRMAVPARFRPTLSELAGSRLVIAPAPGGEVRLYPQPLFEQIAREQIQKLTNPEHKKALLRGFIGRAIHLDMDGQGRVLIPGQYRAALSASAVLVGQVDYFALWSEAEWTRQEAALSDDDFAAAGL